jgi:hypothetical protein
VGNNEQGFTEADVRALCDVARSTKIASDDTTSGVLAKKAAAESFHGAAGAAPWQMEASYMPDDFNGAEMAGEMAIGAMFDRIVANWPGASYASASGQQGGVIKIEDFVTPEEAEHLIQIGDEAGLDTSSGTGAKQADGTFKVRHPRGALCISQRTQRFFRSA